MKYLSIISYFFSFILLLIIIFILAVDQNFFNLKNKIYKTYPNIQLRKFVFNKHSIMHHFNNDYNIKYLPETQFEKLEFYKKKINFSEEYYKNLNKDQSISYKQYGTFFINSYKDDLMIIDYQGSIYRVYNFENEVMNKNEINPKKILSNIKLDRVFDSFIYNNKLYISYSRKEEGCQIVFIDFADLENKKLEFKNFFKSEECNDLASPGKMQVYKNKDKVGMIFSIAEGAYNKPGKNIQNKNSIFGKIIFIPFDKSPLSIFSMGHRVIQGLYSDQKVIISTEHGPRGGDEINKIEINENYGWPIASFGERYDFNYSNNKIFYKKKHHEENFKDPIFSFIEGIGISEIIKLSKGFSKFYDDHFVLSSLNGNSVYFIKFNHNYEKILTIEKIFINHRIRDLEYYEKKNIILLALEENGEIGIMFKNL